MTDITPEQMIETTFQQRIKGWMMECFSMEICRDSIERNHRFLEESLELVQSNGCTSSEAHQLVDYVFNRPVGEIVQECGGVMVTLAALCCAEDIDMHSCAELELHRIKEPGVMDKIRAKQAAKPKHSPLPESPASAPKDIEGDIKTLREFIELKAKTAELLESLGKAFHGKVPCERALEALDRIAAREAQPDGPSYEDLMRTIHQYQERTGQILMDTLNGKWTHTDIKTAIETHSQHVREFLEEMCDTMGVERTNIKDACAALLVAARQQREQLADRQGEAQPIEEPIAVTVEKLRKMTEDLIEAEWNNPYKKAFADLVAKIKEHAAIASIKTEGT